MKEKKSIIRSDYPYELHIITKGNTLSAFSVKDASADDEVCFFPNEPNFVKTYEILTSTKFFSNECRDILY